MSDRELLQRSFDALEFSVDNAIAGLNNAINDRAHEAEIATWASENAVLQALRRDLRARLSEPEWIPVGERLPVVPKGLMRVRVWCFNNQTGAVWKTAFHIPEKKMHTQATHWRYAESTPQPPKDNP